MRKPVLSEKNGIDWMEYFTQRCFKDGGQLLVQVPADLAGFEPPRIVIRSTNIKLSLVYAGEVEFQINK